MSDHVAGVASIRERGRRGLLHIHTFQSLEDHSVFQRQQGWREPTPLPTLSGYCRRSLSNQISQRKNHQKIFHLYFLCGPPSGNIFYLASFAKQIEFWKGPLQVYAGLPITPVSHFHPNLHEVTQWWLGMGNRAGMKQQPVFGNARHLFNPKTATWKARVKSDWLLHTLTHSINSKSPSIGKSFHGTPLQDQLHQNITWQDPTPSSDPRFVNSHVRTVRLLAPSTVQNWT